jgi:hypothetical protein
LILVAAGVCDHQAEVRVDHALLRLEVPALDPLFQLDLLSGSQERVLRDLVEEELEGVGGRRDELSGR